MNIETTGASKRPKLSLAYGRAHTARTEQAANTLSDHELRRIVAAMIG